MAVILREGQIGEFVCSTVHSDGSIRTYELEKLFEHFFGNFAYLRNLETNGRASVTQKWLREGASRAPNGHWRLAE